MSPTNVFVYPSHFPMNKNSQRDTRIIQFNEFSSDDRDIYAHSAGIATKTEKIYVRDIRGRVPDCNEEVHFLTL